MTTGIVFVLHGPADGAYAGELAAALTPLPTLPLRLEPGVQFGGGAVCVVVWTRELCAPAMTQAVLAAVADSSASVVLCKGAAPPDALRARALACLPAWAEASADAEQVRGVIAAMERAAEAAQRLTPTIGRASGAVRGGKQGLATRSAYGLLATLAVVGVAAPMISERAAATNVPPNGAAPSDTTNTATIVAAPAPAEAAAVVASAAAPAAHEAPVFDQWVQSSSADHGFAESLLVQTAAFVAETPAPAFDPKVEALSDLAPAHSAAVSAPKPGAALLASAQ